MSSARSRRHLTDLGAFHRSWVTSLLTTALDVGVLTGLVELAGVHYVLATWLGTVVGSLANFTINRQWAFSATHGRAHWQLVRFLPVQAGSSALQTVGVWLFTQFAGLQYIGSKIAVAVIVYLAWNYPMNRFFVFGHFARGRGLSRAVPEAARRLSA